MLWVDKYRPHALDKFELHRDIADNLAKLVVSGDFPHTLFYGPPGAGKKTLVMALLREIYGPGAEKIRVETRPWQIELPTRKLEIELTSVSSNYHVELHPADVGNNDRYVVQEIIKELARNRPIDTTGQKSFKVLVLTDVDSLSREAQQSLRRTMEKYSSACRLVMTCSNVSRVMDPVRSRCLCVRVASPTNEEIMNQLQLVARKESLALPPTLAARLVAVSGRNLRRALLGLEVARAQSCPLKDDQPVGPPDWELYIAEVAGDVVREQSPKQLLVVRGKVYELLASCVPPELILRTLLCKILERLDDEVKVEAVQLAAFYEHRLREGAKAIFHIEAFVAKFMSYYKNWSMAQYAS